MLWPNGIVVKALVLNSCADIYSYVYCGNSMALSFVIWGDLRKHLENKYVYVCIPASYEYESVKISPKFKCSTPNVTCGGINKCCTNCTSYEFDTMYTTIVSEVSLIHICPFGIILWFKMIGLKKKTKVSMTTQNFLIFNSYITYFKLFTKSA